jgi:hypothetical protein
VQVPSDVHGKADARRRREKRTWDRVISVLLQRWGDGDDTGLTAPMRKPKLVQMPPEPGSERARFLALSAEWDRQDPELAKRLAEKVDISKLTRYPSLGALLAAGAAKAGRVMPPEIIAEIDAEDDADERSDG